MEATIHCKYDTLADPRTLRDHHKNRNKHSDEQIERLAKLYGYHGVRHPIIVSSLSGCIVAGHGRKLAAIKAGIPEMPVVFQSFADESAEYAFIQADNAIALWADLDLAGINADLGDLGPDFDLEMLGIEDFTLDIAEKLEPGCDEDDVPEARPEPKVVRGEVYILGNHRLMCGDSTAITDVERLMNLVTPDVVHADPPYGIEIVGGGKSFGSVGGGNKVKANSYSTIIGDETTETAKEFYQTSLAVGASNFVIWGGNYFTDFLPPKKCWIVWDKKGREWDDNFSDFEMAWTSFEKPAKIITHVWMGMVQGGEREKRIHPTQKPAEMVAKTLNYIEKSKTVYDGFGGSGSTLIACEKTDRHCFMMELDPIYCGVILDRWQKFTGKKAHREDGVAWDEIKGAD